MASLYSDYYFPMIDGSWEGLFFIDNSIILYYTVYIKLVRRCHHSDLEVEFVNKFCLSFVDTQREILSNYIKFTET